MTGRVSRFDRIWNSTLGLPQQVAFRLWEVLKGERNLFSEEGLFDRALIPFFGAGDTHEKDVMPEDVFGKNVGAQILGSILTDPLSFMSFGATAVGRLGLASSRALNILKTAEEGVQTFGKAGDLLDTAKKLLLSGSLPKKTGKLLRKSLSQMEKEFKRNPTLLDRDLESVLALSGESVRRFTLPMGIFGDSWNIPASAVTKKGWLSWMASGAVKPISFAYGLGISKHMPILPGILKPIGDSVEALIQGGRTALAERYVVSSGGDVTTLLKDRGGIEKVFQRQDTLSHWWAKAPVIRDSKAAEQVFGAYSEPEKAFLREVLGFSEEAASKLKPETIQRRWAGFRKGLGLEPAELSLDSLKALPEDVAKVRNLDEAARNQFTLQRELTEEYKGAPGSGPSRGAFELGETVVRSLKKVFTGITGIGALDTAERASRAARTSYTRLLKTRLQVVGHAYRELGTLLGESPDRVASVFSALAQSTPDVRDIERARGLAISLAESGSFSAVEKVEEFAGKGGVVDSFLSRLLQLEEQAVASSKGSNLDKALVNYFDSIGLPKAGASVSESRVKKLVEGRESLEIWAKAEKARYAAWLKTKQPGDVFKAQMAGVGTSFAAIEEALEGLAETNLLPFWQMLEKSPRGKEILESLWGTFRDMQLDHEKFAEVFALHGLVAPIAYIPRVLSIAERAKVQQLLGDSPIPELHRLLKDVRARNPRTFDQLSVQGLNELIDEFISTANRAGGGEEIEKLVGQLTEVVPEMRQKYATDVFSSMAASLSTLHNYNSGAKFLTDLSTRAADELLSGKTTKLPLVGRIVAIGDAVGAVRPVQGVTLTEDLLKLTPRGDAYLPQSWIAVEVTGSNGATKLVTVPVQAGERDLGFIFLHDGKTAEEALGSSLLRGQGFVAGEGINKDVLEDLLKQKSRWVALGPKNIVSGAFESIKKQMDEAGATTRLVYDSMHAILKTAVTTISPSFHWANLISSVSMLSMEGIPFRAQVRGLGHAMAFLGLNDEQFAKSGSYGRLLLGLGGPKKGFLSRARRTMRLFGARKEDLANMVFETGDGRSWSLAELIVEMGNGGLLNSHAVSGLQGASQETFTIKQALKGSGGLLEAAKNVAGKGWEKLRKVDQAAMKARVETDFSTALENFVSSTGASTEIIARLTGFFGALDMGYSPRMAVRKTVAALFDYADLTPIERKFAKRAISFYTFPRKMLVKTFNHAQQKPATAAAAVHSVFGLRSGDAVRTEFDFGRPQLHLGEYRVNLSRFFPGLDLLTAGALAGDMFFDWEQIGISPQGRAESPFDLAIPAQILSKLIPGERAGEVGGMEEALGEVLSLSYTTRWATRVPEAPGQEESWMASFNRTAFGVTTGAQQQQKKFLLGRMRLMDSKLRLLLEQTTDTEDRQELQHERLLLRQETLKLMKERP